MVAASDIPRSWSLAPGLLVVSEMFLCTLSLVVCISARPRVMRTAGEGHAWCNAACWTQPCLALIILSSALSSPWWPPNPSQPCGNGSAVGRARAGRGTEGLPGSSLLWGWSGSRNFCTVGGQSLLQPVPSADGQRGCLSPLGCPTHWQPLTPSMATCGGGSPKGLPGGSE